MPYVGLDYVTPTTALIERAAQLGHERAVYVHHDLTSPAADDRMAAVRAADAAGVLQFDYLREADLAAVVDAVGAATVVFAEDSFLAEDVIHTLSKSGISAPGDLSVASLAEVRGHRVGERALTGFHVPREQVAVEALALLQQLVSSSAEEDWPQLDTQRLLSAEVEFGATLVERRAQ